MKRVVVFLGPSLAAADARAIVPCEVRPPARQGDVFRALVDRPDLIVLIDGVFEHSPSVWHHEIVAAHAAGVRMIGASSMGALRAAEFVGTRMIEGVGEVFRAYATGGLVDDGEVALLHASAEHDFRPLTVPLVNVRQAAAAALRAKVLNRGEAIHLVETAKGTFYQARSWPELLRRTGWTDAVRERWLRFAKPGLPDVKADDARLALKTARRWLAKGTPRVARKSKSFPSHVRRRRVHDDAGAVMNRLARAPDVEEWGAEGARRKLIAFWARELGVRIFDEEREAAEVAWLEELGEVDRESTIAASGMDESQARVFFEELALDRKALRSSLWLVSDAFGADEAMAFEARRRGTWAQLARSVTRNRR